MKRLALAIVCWAATAAAQPKPDERAQAASHFKQGQLYYKAGDWDRAITEYEDAYELSHEPLLIFNIALCDDRAQRSEKALDGFQKYLALAPDGQVADEAREDVARLTPVVDQIRAKRAAEEAQRAEQAKRAEEAKRAEQAKRADAARRAEQAAAEHARREAVAERVERRSRLETYASYAAGGAGLVALGLGVHYGLVARDDGNAVSAHTSGPWTDALLAKQTEGQSANTKMIVLTSIGGAFALGGGVLWWLGHRDANTAEELRVDVAPLPGGVAMGVSARF